MRKIYFVFCVFLMCCGTFAQADTVEGIPITLVSTFPEDGATNVPPSRYDEINAKFNQEVVITDVSKITINSKPLTAERVWVSGTDIFLMSDYFTPSTLYTVVIEVGAIDGLTSEVRWSFTTIDISTLTVTPEDGATDVPVNVEITFAKQGSTGSTGYYVHSLAKIFIDNNQLPNVMVERMSLSTYKVSHQPLAYNTLHKVIVPTYQIDDGVEFLPDYANGYLWSFTTEAAPEKELTIPVDNATNVALTGNIQVKFSKTIFEGSAGLNSISVKDEAGNEIATTKSATASILFIYREENLTANTKYTVTIPANAILGVTEAITYSFTTNGSNGIDDVNANSAIVVYPTVSKGNITVVTPAPATINIADLTGKKLAVYQSDGYKTIDLNYANGLYVVSVKTGNQIVSYKVILER